MVKIVKNPGNGRLNNLNDPVLKVLILINSFGMTAYALLHAAQLVTLRKTKRFE